MGTRDDWDDDDIVFEDEVAAPLRPYLVTSGRTRATVEGLAFETLVERVGEPDPAVRFESADILARSEQPISVAELSAHLSIPLGTAMVLVGDLVADGRLRAHRTINAGATADVSLVTRIIAGVKQL